MGLFVVVALCLVRCSLVRRLLLCVGCCESVVVCWLSLFVVVCYWSLFIVVVVVSCVLWFKSCCVCVVGAG